MQYILSNGDVELAITNEVSSVTSYYVYSSHDRFRRGRFRWWYLMKITSMRIKSKKPTPQQMRDIMLTFELRFNRAGFVTGVNQLTSTSIKLGLHMRSFKLDLSKHDRNLRHNPHLPSKLDNSPTWDQRVEFNDIVNAVLNKFRVSANVKSGPFTVRVGRNARTEWDWQHEIPEWIRHNEARGYYVEQIDEKQYLEDRRIERNKIAAQRRAEKRNNERALANDAKRVLGLV